MRNKFDEQLEMLHTELIEMGALCEKAIDETLKVLMNGDTQTAQSIMKEDNAIDLKERDIESLCLKLLLQQQPVAGDLRKVSAALKMITDMERIGDQAADIADLALREESGSISELAHHIPEMARIAVVMVSEAVGSFVSVDLENARRIIAMDDKIDHLFEVVKTELIGILKEQSARADEVINAMMIAKYLERIGDHAVNICEWVEFYETGIHKQTRIL